LSDLEEEDEPAPESNEQPREAPDPVLVQKELERVNSFIQRAAALPRDSKAQKLLDVMRVIAERPPERRRAVIFTESLATQTYLHDLLIESGTFTPGDITLFRGANDSPRASEALERWQAEIGGNLPPYQRPSRTIAIRLALVHEFKTCSQVFISTDAG